MRSAGAWQLLGRLPLVAVVALMPFIGAAQSGSNLNCKVGPVEKTYGGTKRPRYGWDDPKRLIVVTAPREPAPSRELTKNNLSLSLHIPAPKCRPGDKPDFSNLIIPDAGAAPRPDIAALPRDMMDLAWSLIRVLDAKGRAIGPWDPRLNPETLRRALAHMLIVRAFDDRMYRAQRQGKTSFYMKCTGEEAIAVAQAYALDRGDMCFPSYRQQGLLIARGYPLTEMMNQIYSNPCDPVKGPQLPIMYSTRE